MDTVCTGSLGVTVVSFTLAAVNGATVFITDFLGTFVVTAGLAILSAVTVTSGKLTSFSIVSNHGADISPLIPQVSLALIGSALLVPVTL
jgi:hypothetical protein